MPEISGNDPVSMADLRPAPAGSSRETEPMIEPRIASDALMQGRREIVIVHDGSSYRLRITSNNKLILTK
jgi:hemin uptake protein HemP